MDLYYIAGHTFLTFLFYFSIFSVVIGFLNGADLVERNSNDLIKAAAI